MHIKNCECSPERLFISLNNRFDDCIKLVTLKNLPKALLQACTFVKSPFVQRSSTSERPQRNTRKGWTCLAAKPYMDMSFQCLYMKGFCREHVSPPCTLPGTQIKGQLKSCISLLLEGPDKGGTYKSLEILDRNLSFLGWQLKCPDI